MELIPPSCHHQYSNKTHKPRRAYYSPLKRAIKRNDSLNVQPVLHMSKRATASTSPALNQQGIGINQPGINRSLGTPSSQPTRKGQMEQRESDLAN